MINSPKLAPEVRDCRGLILSEDFKSVYCKPFTRFFNMGECPETTNFSFANAQVLEKVDGSMINMWHHPEIGWCVATRNRAFGEGETSFGTTTFFDLISTIVDFSQLEEDLKGYEDYTFTFEFVSPETKVVKDYGKKRSLYFLAMHNNKTCEYIEDGRSIFSDILKNATSFKSMRFPEEYNLHTYEDIKKCMDGLDMTDEGFVCYNYDTHVRVKVKNPKYLEISYMRYNGGITEKAVVNMVFSNECDEYLSYYPEDEIIINPYRQAYTILKNKIEEEYERVKNRNFATRKEIAVYLANNPYRDIIFRLLSGSSIEEIFERMSIRARIDHLKMLIIH